MMEVRLVMVRHGEADHNVKESQRVVLPTDNAPDLQQADLSALSEALEHARRRHNIL